MSAAEIPLPAELAVDQEPFDDDLLDRYLFVATGSELMRRDGPSLDDFAPNRWQVTDDGAAQWAMAKLAELENERDRQREQAKAWKSRIDDWLAAQFRKTDARVGFFTGHLEAYALAERERSGRATLHLPSGLVRTTEHQPKVVVEDEQAMLAWLKRPVGHLIPVDDVVRKAEGVLVSELRKHVEIVEVIDVADLELSCGDRGAWYVDGRGPIPEIGQDITCPGCGDTVKVTAVVPARWHDEVRTRSGATVTGAGIEPAHTDAKVVPEA